MRPSSSSFPGIFVVLFYLAMALAAWLWAAVVGLESLWFYPSASLALAPPRGQLALGLLAGLLGGLLLVWIGRLLERFAWSTELYRWFASLLGAPTWPQALLLAGASSLGEELLFRGAVQQSWGLAIASVAFMVVHLPPRRGLAWWTVLAGAMGALFGLGTQLSGNLGFAIGAHFTVNLLNLHRIGRYGGRALAAPHVEDPAPPAGERPAPQRSAEPPCQSAEGRPGEYVG